MAEGAFAFPPYASPAEMARHLMPVGPGLQFRPLGRAERQLANGAAWVEMAARRRMDRVRHLALEDDALALHFGVGDRHRREEGLGIGVERGRVELARCRDLDDAAQIHDRDPR